jgi:predicted outer membrane repeat protein
MKKLTILIILCNLTFCAFSRIIYVDADGTGDYPTIQSAVNAAENDDVVILQQGTYVGDGNRDIDIMNKAITIRGATHDANDCVIDCNGTPAYPHRGFCLNSGEERASIFENLSIIKGYAYLPGETPEAQYYRGGGAIKCEHGTALIKNCIFTDNYSLWGGAVYPTTDKTILVNCRFNHNSASSGGAVYINEDITVSHCYFANNVAANGGAIYVYYTNPCISTSDFQNNYSHGFGGAIENNGGYPAIMSCNFYKNSASYWGGAIANGSLGSSIIMNCRFIENSSIKSAGGAIFNTAGKNPFIIIGCLFERNHADGYGGGVCNSGSKPAYIYSCTFVANSAHFGGGAAQRGSSVTTSTFSSCILGSNSALYGPEIYNGSNSSSILKYCNIKYSNIQGEYSGLGNIDVDPCFVDPEINDFHLLPDSPCINAGDPNYTPEPNETDLDGLPRVIGGRIDMGAYEFNHLPVAVAGPNQTAYAFINGLADVTLDGSASYDDDNDLLDYYWSWTIDSNVYEANGVSPAIQLPVGQHQIELVVDDGIDLSKPDYCTVTIIEPLRTKLWFWPPTINCGSRPQNIITFIYLPKGIEPDDINNASLIMYPCNIQSKYQRMFRISHGRYAQTMVMAVFDKDQICDFLGPGWYNVDVAGRLQTGRYFYGTSMLRITRPHYHHWPFRPFYNPH